MATAPDTRTTQQIFRQWERLNAVKNQLIKMGLANGNTPPAEVVAVLRQQLPADLFADADAKHITT